jgi:hypothetical protein
VFGPKIPNSQEYFTLMATEVWSMCGGKQTAAECGKKLKANTEAFIGKLAG